MQSTAMVISNIEYNGSGDENPAAIAQRFSHQVDTLVSKADELEERVKEVAQFYESKKQVNNKGSSSSLKCKDSVLSTIGGNNSFIKKHIDEARKEVVCSKRMQEVMRQFGTVLKQLSQHKWAWPFMQPVDVEGLGLHDYYEVIKKPMDFTTIRTRMDANAYKNAREIYADVRLVFSNAMTYNDEKHDVHVMAKTLLEKFEEKWLQLLPKVIEAEARLKEEDAVAMVNVKVAQEAAFAKMARDTDTELSNLNSHLNELRELVVQRCRKTSTEEKRKLSVGLSALPPEDLSKVIDIITQTNPNFPATADQVDIDMDAQSEVTLWRLKFFVKEALERQAKDVASKADDTLKLQVKSAATKADGTLKLHVKHAATKADGTSKPQVKNAASNADDQLKRKKEIIEALVRTKKRNKKLP